jgi:hypothetical protein
MSNTRFFNPRRNGAWSGIGIDRAAARSNAMQLYEAVDAFEDGSYVRLLGGYKVLGSR